ncbi:MAG: DUF4388 domain-containing protein [Nitrospinae bacterium]|nr:DUF4388 domain-containing protein [Nitrospinota bacterium]
MALQGSLDDFNILNILQMIKLEGKTGRLTLTEGEELVKVTFDNGSIIFAEISPVKEESRLKATLTHNKILDAQSWNEVKKEHDDSLKPLWELLSKKIPAQTLVELMRRHILDNVYYALRWKRGNYEFTPMKGIKYNDKVMTPMDVDAVLMEGCRIADEWPRITSSIPPLATFVVKSILGEDEYDSLNLKTAEGAGQDFKSSIEFEILTARGVALTDAQINILSIMGSGKTITDILDSARQGHFTSLTGVQRLMELGIIKSATRKKDTTIALDHTGGSARYVTMFFLVAALAGGIAWQVMSWPQQTQSRKASVAQLNTAHAKETLKKIERALKVHIALRGTPPSSLSELVHSGALSAGDLTDPWGNPYQFIHRQDKFSLFSNGPDAYLATDNIYLPPASAPGKG